MAAWGNAVLRNAELQPVLAALAESSLDSLVLADDAGRVIAFNAAAEATFGYAREEAIGLPVSDLIVPHDLKAAHDRGFARYVGGGRGKFVGKRFETEARRKDGSTFPVELSLTETKLPGQRVFAAAFRDLSERVDTARLAKIRRQLELAVEGAQLGIWSYNPRTGISWYSDRAKEIVGLEDSFDDEGEAYRRRVHPDDRAQLVFDRRDGDFPVGPVATEYRVVHPDGATRWVHSLGAAERDPSGEVEAVHGVIIDITSQRTALDQLGSTRRQLELAVQGAQLGAWSFDMQTRRTWYSKRSKAMYGLPPETEMTTEVLRASIHPDDWEAVADPYLNGFKEDRVEIEYRVLCPDGSTRWIHSLGAADRDADGVARTVSGIHLDITDRKRAEEALEEARLHLELAVDGAQLGIWTVDPRTGETWYSDRSRNLWGVDKELRLDAETLKRYIHPDDWHIVIEPYRKDFPGDRIAFEHRVVWPNGDVRWVQSLGTAQRDAHGVVQRVSGIHLDVTQRKGAEEELARSRDALHQSEKLSAMGSLLAGVSHELNNPLAAIVGQAEMLEEDSRGTPLEARAKKISSAAGRCARIVQTFLAMARQKAPEKALVDVNDVISAALEITDYALRTSGVAVRVTFGTSLPPVEGDRDQLHQVLVNLILNAQQAMEDGEQFDKTLTIRTSLGPTGTVLIDVCDTGPGVPEAVRGRLFEPFFTTKPQGSGTGVGLSLSQGVVEAHGGTLTIEPSRRGAHFRVALPAAAQGALVAIPLSAADAEYAGAGGRALIVEDESDVAETLRELLEREGYQVRIAHDGAEALMALDREDFDLILSDLRMPGVSGPDLHARLAETRPHLLSRIGFVTGDTLGSSMDEFLRGCGRPVLEKPFTRVGVRCLIASIAAPQVQA
ncbi:MAG: PAS domain S-box protein [Allosphingosinicella sp.]